MKIKVIERGETEFTASTDWTDPAIREALKAGNDVDDAVRSVISDTTDCERVTDSDEYVTVTEDDGTVLWSGWLTGDKDKPAPGSLDIDMHRWYAVIKHDGETFVIGVQGRDGLGRYASVAEWEAVNS